MGAELSDQYILQSSRNALKSEIKQKTKNAAFRYLKNLQSQHSKISDIKYPIFETQKYMTSPIYINDEVNLLHALRSRSINVKHNFSSKYRNDMSCPLCSTGMDDQQHILDCSVLKKKLVTKEAANNKVVYEDIFEDYLQQKEVTHLFAAAEDQEISINKII